MMRILWKDIQSMLRRPLVFILLFIGLVVGGFSLLVYYVSSSRELKLNRAAYGVETVVEARSAMNDPSEIEKLLATLQENDFPEVYYVSAMYYGNAEYDIVGLYWEEENLLANGEGRFIDRTMMGTRSVVVPADFKRDQETRIGEIIDIAGQPFEIVGLSSANTGYSPIVYDMRRLPEGTEDIAGVKLDRPWRDELKDRPEKGIIIPLDTFASIGLSPDYYRITFADEITPAQRNLIEVTLMEKRIFGEVTDMTQFMEIHRINHLSKVLIYFAAIAAGIINIVSLFVFFLRENRKQYITYKILGATNGRIVATIIAELSIYILVSFMIGCAGAIPFIQYSGLVGQHMPFGLGDILLLFFALLCVGVLISFKEIYNLATRSIVQLHAGLQKSNKKLHRSKQDRGDEYSRFKTLYMLAFRYGKTNLVRTISIVFLSLVTAFSLSYAMTYVFESGRYDRYMKKVFPNDIYEFMYDMDFYMELDQTLYDYNKISYLDNAELERLISTMEGLHGTKGIGRMTSFISFYPGVELSYGDPIYRGAQVNRAFAANAPVPLKKGSWEPLAQYDKQDETSVIPVIIPPYLEDKFEIGTDYTMTVRFITGIAPHPDNKESYEIVEDKHARKFRIVGVLAEDALNLRDGDLINDLSLIIDDHFDVIRDDSYRDDVLPTSWYIPEIMHNGKHDTLNWTRPTYYLFPESDSTKYRAEWDYAIRDYGVWESFSDCIEIYVDNFQQSGGNIYFMHAAVASALLILGVGGYSIMLFAANRRMYGIYYVCGMPWSKAAGLTVAGNALDMLLPAAVGAVAGVYVSQGIRVFDETTIALSILTGLGAVAAVYALTSAIIALSMRKARPKRLMTADGQ